MDMRLRARLEKMMLMLDRGGLNEITLDQDCSFDSYNVFKEEYVSISPLPLLPKDFGIYRIENTERTIEDEPLRHRVLTQSFIFDNQIYQMEIGEGLSSMDQLNQTIRKFSIRVMIIVILISIFIDVGFVNVLLRPFFRIINVKLKGIDHPESFNYDLVRTNTSEFTYLDKSINDMMLKVQEAFRLEREFITNVSHELLTPVSILKNRLENLMNDPDISPDAMKQLADSQKTLSRLTRVVKALLYISKIESQQYLRDESVSLPEIISDIEAELAEMMEEKNLKVEKNLLHPFIYHPGNRSLLQTMLFNLISNAVKYSPRDARISISDQMTASHYHLTIADQGNGIDPENLPYIFDRFKRFRPDDQMSYGLGLPIVKTIADFHQLEIDVKSRIGQGSEFTLRFPLQPNPAV